MQLVLLQSHAAKHWSNVTHALFSAVTVDAHIDSSHAPHAFCVAVGFLQVPPLEASPALPASGTVPPSALPSPHAVAHMDFSQSRSDVRGLEHPPVAWLPHALTQFASLQAHAPKHA